MKDKKDSSRKKGDRARAASKDEGASDPLVAPTDHRSSHDGVGTAELLRLAALTADIGLALTQGDTMRDMLQRCADALVRHLDAAFARIWTLDERESVLELQASSGMYTHLDGPHGRVPVGRFKIGLIAEERCPHLTNDIAGDERIGDQEWAAREGMRAFAGYPLIVEDRLVGVMAMFARHALSSVTLDAMASVANGIALGVERKRAEVALSESEEQFRILADSIPQLAWMAEADGHIFWYNRRWYEYTGTTFEEMEGWGWQKAHDPNELGRVIERFKHSLDTGAPWEDTFPLLGQDGEYRRFLSRAQPIRDAEGRILRWFGTNTDIEDQKRTETLLAQLGEERERLLEELLTPLVPVLEGVLVLPLVGALDTARMQRATQAALNETRRTCARVCIIDITGARIADSQAIANLSKLVAALRLTGAEAMVTGVTAEAARSIVSLGLDLRGMRTHRTLAQAISELLKRGCGV